MPGDGEPGPPLHDRVLDDAPLHRLDGAASFAANVLVMFADRLEPGLPVAQIDPQHLAIPLELFQRAKHRREVRPDAAPG